MFLSSLSVCRTSGASKNWDWPSQGGPLFPFHTLVLLGVTRCYSVLLGVTWCYLVLLGVTQCYFVFNRRFCDEFLWWKEDIQMWRLSSSFPSKRDYIGITLSSHYLYTGTVSTYEGRQNRSWNWQKLIVCRAQFSAWVELGSMTS